ncbi:MAG: hypothetical protein BWY63_01945 [Chloroflexi bacterium ADurb.Bin360]|nr:MAG: hypothetical protein BWY63_01945 [Chloroflexi bacterium ADurb.Bin360]
MSMSLSPLDIDLGLSSPCDLNVFWACASAAGRGRAERQIAEVLRARYTPGGQVRRTLHECAALWKVSDGRAHAIITRALRRMQHPEYVRQYNRRKSNG